MNLSQTIATELAVRPAQVEAAVRLLDEGATVPFIARYRKEVTGGLDDTQLRTLEERLGYLRELEDRRAAVLASIGEQGRLTDALRADILAADTKTRLEDLYLPYKPKRRTKAQIAREAGLAPLAETLLADPQQAPEALAAGFVAPDRGVADVKAALDGARQILMETFAEDAELLGRLRERLWSEGVLASRLVDGRQDEGAKFSDYFDFAEPLHKVPSHRALALLRGRNEGVLTLGLDLPVAEGQPHPAEAMIAARFGVRALGRPADAWLTESVRWAWKIKLSSALDTELKNRLREAAETEAIRVFATNLKDLLLAAPAGPRAVLGLDPGLRTGCKVAVVDATGKLLATETIHPHVPHQRWDEALAKLAVLCRTHAVALVAIGNGTASRETDRLVAELIRREPGLGLGKIVVSEAGASVYSASELAALEFPGLDVSLRGAVSIARRLQDPLAELVKIEPKAIGVGQYQHDVNQTQLARSLDAVVEDCVNAVGVDVNTASVPLLTRVSGLNATLARNIVAWRDANGAFRNRAQLLKVPRLGDKTFEQAAGFLRIAHGDNPLDRSAVHPEAYPVVERILKRAGRDIGGVLGDTGFLRGLRPEQYTDGRFGVPTVRDIIAELEKPGRDPRPEFRTAAFREGVEDLKDLEADMVLEGVVTNVTNFGAFVDIGVHQDGLVHVSCLSEKFVKDPHQVVRAGDVVRVKVLEVDVKRRRIALTMRLADQARDHQPGAGKPAGTARSGRPPQAQPPARAQKPAGGGAFADAFARARRK
ncbi:MAG TPA: Tex family protein [Plasticicumulans sp.]|uniref:Tex family protein n=1 Tax=Plasticicumulans sp. TaxID=2307179 RepID=UPI002CCD3E3D|nr:Tex family protein [Plasticicumulans sp.]HMW29508.1 Tex family protein [Plasticicumulans sp.]HMW41376.1 Tex family protein [Plasticicumulans sp.]HNG48635.1 Tex family protein [Plasticicumulans sp.]HNJ08880.1 Tex family protein [Plasticicumulans sp.]HNM44587.1 Tex family protein [Plasticicumulans sp.]